MITALFPFEMPLGASLCRMTYTPLETSATVRSLVIDEAPKHTAHWSAIANNLAWSASPKVFA